MSDKGIDAKIAKTEGLLAEAQRWASLLGTLQNNLAVLKRAKTLLEQDEILPEPNQYTHVMTESEIPLLAQRPPEPKAQTQEGSIGKLIVAVLTEAQSSLSPREILERVHEKGRTEVTLKTLGGVLSQYLVKGAIRRTARAMYALSATNGATMHSG